MNLAHPTVRCDEIGASDAPPQFVRRIAAHARLARGDTFGVVRYLREAYERTDSEFPPDLSAMAIRSEADSELHKMLDKIGVPRFH